MRALRLAAAIMLLASPAFAQIPKLNLLQDKPGKSEDEKNAEAAQDRAYKDLPEEDPGPEGASRSLGHGAKRGYAIGEVGLDDEVKGQGTVRQLGRRLSIFLDRRLPLFRGRLWIVFQSNPPRGKSGRPVPCARPEAPFPIACSDRACGKFRQPCRRRNGSSPPRPRCCRPARCPFRRPPNSGHFGCGRNSAA